MIGITRMRLCLLGLAASVLVGAAAPGSTGFGWQKSADALSLVLDDRVVWRFNQGVDQPKSCFHPLTVRGGPDLTGFRPEDHRWHRALWFSWKFINGVNYWEEDPATGRSEGRTELKATGVETRADFSARIEQELEYRPANGTVVLREQRNIAVSPPDAEGSYAVDWLMTFTAVTNAILDRTPLPEEKEGKPYGGYAGLSVRFAKDFGDVRAITTNGLVTFDAERFRGKSPGMDYSGRVGGREYGIAILDHPKNLNAPSPWYAIHGAEMRYFSPAVLCYGPHVMKAGDTLNLRYRVIVHPGRWEVGRLTEELRRYAAER
jgi:hypothetical protein